jgi:uncharacterized OB-fold protein
MPKIAPVPDELSKPFWDAVNEKKLIVQQCNSCNTLQYPPRAKCQDCDSENLGWKETGGKGHILAWCVVEDSHLPVRAQDQPFNLAIVTLDEDPRINFFANLPGTTVRKVPTGAEVEVTFEEVGPGQMIHEWKVVGQPTSAGPVY